MSSNFIPLSLQYLWRTWNIRGFMLLSLFLQLLLALLAPLRPRTPNKVVILLVCSAFILADWVAIFTFGLISNAQRSDTPVVNNNIMAFWSAFLLIHLGGPDSNNSFSLEDNTLWLHNLVGLTVQVAVFFYIFLKTLPDNNLVLPTAFIFLAGVSKYAERTRTLYLASLENLKKSIFQSSTSGPESNGPDETSDDQVIAEQFFRTFKGLIVDIMPSYAELSRSRNFFLKRTANYTFKLISIELSLMYAVFYTKFLAVSSRWGICIRIMAFCSGITALVLFSLSDKGDFDKVDIGVSYTLLVGVIILDMDSAIILLQSNWFDPASANWGVCASLQSIVLMLLGLIIAIMEIPLCFCGVGPVLDLLWSGRIGAFNLLDYCLKESRRRMEGGKLRQAWNSLFDFVAAKFGLKDHIDQLRYKSQNDHKCKLWDYIFDELHDKALQINDSRKAKEVSEAKGGFTLQKKIDDSGKAKEVSEAKGGFTIQKKALPIDDSGKAKEVSEAKGSFTLQKNNLKELMHYVTDFEYDEEILVWHVATEICYHIGEDGNDHERTLCKVLSDYMLYLLVMQQKLTSSIAGIGEIRFRNSCSEVSALWEFFKTKDVKELCVKILEETNSHEPAREVKERGKSVLHDACKLAEILRQNDKKWEITSSVWVEILSYAANHCRPDNHARMVCEGGELISFVWLLMAHFGIVPRFPIHKDL